MGIIRWRQGTTLTLLGIVAASTPAHAAPPASTQPASRPARAGATREALDGLVRNGQQAISANDFALARSTFLDVIDSDRRNTKALHGLGLAYLGLNLPAKAQEALERAMESTPTPDRALVLNTAVAQISARNPMRGAKIVMAYLTAHPEPPDEPLLNALAIAMLAAEGPARQGRLFVEAEAFYTLYNRRLEAKRPGMKRWGSQWFSAAEVDRKIAANTAAQANVERMRLDIPRLERIAKLAEDRARRARTAAARSRAGAIEAQDALVAQKEADDAAAELAHAREVVADPSASLDLPQMPATLTALALDDVTPPAIEPPVVVATLIPDPPDPTPRRRKPKRPAPVDPENPAPVEIQKPATRPAQPPAPTVTVQRKAVGKVLLTRYATAFPVAPDLLLTAADAVKGATAIDCQSADGFNSAATVVRVDAATGLALIRIADRKLPCLRLADAFAGGAVQCAAYTRVSLFEPKAEMIAGALKLPAGGATPGATLALAHHPRVPGAPVLSAGRVVAVELADRESDPAHLPVAILEQVRGFLGDDLPRGPMPAADAVDVLCQLTVTTESE